MLGEFRSRVHRRGELLHNTVEGAFLTANALAITLLTLMVLFLGVVLFRAT